VPNDFPIHPVSFYLDSTTLLTGSRDRFWVRRMRKLGWPVHLDGDLISLARCRVYDRGSMLAC